MLARLWSRKAYACQAVRKSRNRATPPGRGGESPKELLTEMDLSRGSTPFDRSKPYVQPPVARGIIRCGAEGGSFEQQGCLGHNWHRCRNGHMRDGIQAVLVCANRGRTAVRGHSRYRDLPTGRIYRFHDEGLGK